MRFREVVEQTVFDAVLGVNEEPVRFPGFDVLFLFEVFVYQGVRIDVVITSKGCSA